MYSYYKFITNTNFKNDHIDRNVSKNNELLVKIILFCTNTNVLYYVHTLL